MYRTAGNASSTTKEMSVSTSASTLLRPPPLSQLEHMELGVIENGQRQRPNKKSLSPDFDDNNSHNHTGSNSAVVSPVDSLSGSAETDHKKENILALLFPREAVKLLLCFCGLQTSYLTWAYLQEFIMTTEFNPTKNSPTGRFPSAAFCVFCNRCLALVVSSIAVRIRHGAFVAHNKAPLIAFCPCAVSNTVSSWCQYASLKYVAFPVQTVFKSSSIIPVMLMGYVLKGTTYSLSRYIEAAIITTGVIIFSFFSFGSLDEEEAAAMPLGVLCLLGYIVADSFTTQWQDKIYSQYGRSNVDPYQMMLGVNLSALVITTAGLLLSGDVPIVWEFLTANPLVLRYNLCIPLFAVAGQLCIFYTIKEFGPVVFTVIMTTRQMFSICISSIVFGHAISPQAGVGAAMVFAVIFYQIHRKCLDRAALRNKKNPPPAEHVNLSSSPGRNNNNNTKTSPSQGAVEQRGSAVRTNST